MTASLHTNKPLHSAPAASFSARSGARSATVITLLALSLSLGACASRPTHQQVGTVAGAVVGGATGSVLFGSTLGTVAGAAAGALAGSELTKHRR
ncbi:glycine zipper 2TM domain-containing protein [Curvibacter sp. RS43]|uniref:Glycine zipper 2TM domain-containing protein n=1 Tax=Curvibacter microcysteis TaxID=3026419 RepID=A0ABT5MK04_9BURK|nr:MULTISPECIES: glycine zipper 2TM domain-containing protein [unclassified Curvibacter]MDD0812766.1 glycine zipper 2TM domain-containing protein [Curvibacter sp. RS43]MDD0816893.1 glycine zipper 2TM domain-containing protein [Curvibacter sp. HBC28]